MKKVEWSESLKMEKAWMTFEISGKENR